MPHQGIHGLLFLFIAILLPHFMLRAHLTFQVISFVWIDFSLFHPVIQIADLFHLFCFILLSCVWRVCIYVCERECVQMLYLIGVVFHSALTDYNRNCKTKARRLQAHKHTHTPQRSSHALSIKLNGLYYLLRIDFSDELWNIIGFKCDHCRRCSFNHIIFVFSLNFYLFFHD